MNTLKENFLYYLDNQNELVEKYNGRYLVIKDKKVVGDYNSDDEAYFDATSKYEEGSFIIQLCTPGNGAYTQNFNSRVIFNSL